MVEEQPITKCPYCGYPVEIGEHISDCPNANQPESEVQKEKSSDVRQKTPEELKQQFRFAEASRVMDYENKNEVIPISEPPEELFQLSKEEFKSRLADDPNLNEHYQTYLEALMKLRKNEHRAYKYSNKKDEAGDVLSPPEPGAPRKLMGRILKRMQGSGGLTDRFFSDADRKKGEADVESFYDLLNKTLQERPDAFLMNAKELRALFHDDEIKAVAKKAAERDPRLFLFYLDRYDSLLDDSELNELVVQSTLMSPDTIDKLFLKDSVRVRLTQDTLRHCTDQVEAHVLFTNIGQLVQEGVFTRGQAINAFLSRVERRLIPHSVVEEYCSLFTDEEDKTRLKLALDKISQDENMEFTFGDAEKTLNPYAEVLGEEWKKETVERMAIHAPEDLLSELEIVEQYFGESGMEQILERCVAKLETDFSPLFSEQVIRHKSITPDQQKRVMQIMMIESPYEALRNSHILKEVIPESDRPEVFQDLMERYPGSIVYGRRHMEQITHMSDDEKRKFGRELLKEVKDFRFLETYRSNTEDGEFLRNLVPQEELFDFLLSKAELNPYDALTGLDKIRRVVDDEVDLMRFVNKLAKLVPSAILDHFPNFSYLFNEDESKAFLEPVIKTDEHAAIYNFHKWSKAVPAEWANQKLGELIKLHLEEALTSLNSIAGFLDEQERPEIIRSLIKVNPFIAHASAEDIRRFVPDISQDMILEEARQDSDRIRFSPRTIDEIFKRLKRATTPEQKATLLAKGYRIYKSIETIRSEGLADSFLRLYEQEQPSERNEESLLEDAFSFALLKRIEQIPADLEITDTWQKLKDQLAGEIARILEVQDLKPDQQQLAIDSFGGGSPILLYMSKHRENSDIVSLIQETFRQAGLGTYSEWRYEKDRPLHEVQQDGHLPEALTQEQFDGWSEDEQTDLTASLETTSTDVALAIRSILQANVQELGSESLTTEKPEVTLMELKEEIRSIGQELARLGKQLSGADEATTTEIQSQIAELKRYQDRISAERDILRLSMLEAEEVAQGYLKEGKESKRSQKLGKFIKRLRAKFPNADQVFNNIENSLAELGTGDQAAQNLVAEDTSNLETSFKIGSDPVKSCQDYNNGGYNEALLAYVTEPNTKVTIVRNEKNNAIGRRISRLLSLPDGTIAMFLETKYASTASGAVDLVMLTHTVKKAERLGIRVFIKEADAIPEGYEVVDSTETLESKGGRAPYSYVDAAGGGKKRGKFKIRGVKEIKKLN